MAEDYDPFRSSAEVDEDREKRRLDQQQADEDLRGIMVSQSGRRFMWDLLKRCGVFALSFRGDGAEFTAFREGQRNVGLSLLADLTRVCPEHYTQMQDEQTQQD